MIGSAVPAALAAGILFATGAWAKAPAPLLPIALVEDVKSATADVEFMDYVGTGQTITLEPRDTLVLSYLRSCQHETITGGIVRVGADKSDVQGGKVIRTKIACDGGKMQLASAEANASGASAFRLQSVPSEPVLHALPPMLQVPKLQGNDSRTLVIERTDKSGERQEIVVSADPFFELGGVTLKRGATYSATLGSHKMKFRVDAKAKLANAKPGKGAKTPIVSRLLRFPPG
jgi:hypothetical protein